MTRHVVVVADDLTGANDTAAQFAARGWPTLSAFGLDLMAGRVAKQGGVLALTTDARAADDAMARDLTAQAAEVATTGGAAHLYLKVDSTMRGAVAGQVHGALQTWRRRHPEAFALVCPAYPAMRRTVRAGVVRLDGELLEDGPPGRDPVTPVRTSVMAELLPGAVPVSRLEFGGAGDVASVVMDLAAHASVLTMDAACQADLRLVAEVVTRLGPRVLPVGSAGLAAELAESWRPDGGACALPTRRSARCGTGPVLVLITSLHPTAQSQERRLVERLGDDAVSVADARTPSTVAPVVLVSAPRPRGDANSRTGGAVADDCAAQAATLHSRHPFSGAVVTGGDGARALLARWGSAGVAVEGEVREGMPYGTVVGGEVDGLPIVTKAGGFGDDEALLDAVQHLTGRVRA